MSGITIKINLPFFGRKNRAGAESVKFSEVKNYAEKLRNEGKISEYYDRLREAYKNFMDRLDEVERALKILEGNGEKKFTHLVRKNLEGIKKLDEFSIPSFQQFCVVTFYIIDRIVKIPGQIQHEVLGYKNGKETIDLLNSLLRNLEDLKDILAKRGSEYSVVNDLEGALKKHEEIEELMKRNGDVERKIESVTKEREETKNSLEKNIENAMTAESKTDEGKVMEVKKRISSLDCKIEGIGSDIKANLLSARRPIGKILHSKGDKKVFGFFQSFIDHPLENIGERFWEMVNTLKKENIKLDEDERKSLNDFLKFAENELNDKIAEYDELKGNKKKLEDMAEDLSSKNRELIKKFEQGKEDAEKKFKAMSRKLDDLKKEKNDLEVDIEKNIKILESMLSKISGNGVRVELKQN